MIDGKTVETDAKRNKKNRTFEPPNQSKGQVARMVFYMAVRYESEEELGPEKTPDLFIKDEYMPKDNPKSWIGKLCKLIEWNSRFAPTAFEISSNERIYEIQGNRNPFIDQPDWANMIWGSRCK